MRAISGGRRIFCWANIAYFLLGLPASCLLAFWASLETASSAQAGLKEHDGFYFFITYLYPFLLWPIWEIIFIILGACVFALFRGYPRILMLVTMTLVVLSVMFIIGFRL
jgi:hypothetical protein